MMAARLGNPEGRLSFAEIISRKKAQKAQNMQERDDRSPLLDKLLRPGDSNVRDQVEINKLCDIIRQTSFENSQVLSKRAS